jgi:hypothetical protein
MAAMFCDGKTQKSREISFKCTHLDEPYRAHGKSDPSEVEATRKVAGEAKVALKDGSHAECGVCTLSESKGESGRLARVESSTFGAVADDEE